MKANATEEILAVIGHAGQQALNTEGPEQALHELIRGIYDVLGDREAHTRKGALKPGERHFFVAGAFMVTPDKQYHMLVGSQGFPPEQERLLVPLDAGNPGQVYASKSKLLLKNTDEHQEFRQYLKTARMGSVIFAPMIWQGDFIGQLIMAAQARNTMREQDLGALEVIACIAASVWMAQGGPKWLQSAYPPANGFYVEKQGL